MECSLVWNNKRDFKIVRSADTKHDTRSSITILLQLFWNRQIQSTSIFQYFIDPVAGLLNVESETLLHLIRKQNWTDDPI